MIHFTVQLNQFISVTQQYHHSVHLNDIVIARTCCTRNYHDWNYFLISL